MGDVGEECGLHSFHLLDDPLVAISQRNQESQHDDGRNCQEKGNEGHRQQRIPVLALRLPAAVEQFYFIMLPLPS